MNIESYTHQWTLLTNHAHVLMCIAGDTQILVRQIALDVGITERAVQRILSELEEANIIERQRDGRRTTYRINRKQALRHPLEQHHNVGELIDLLVST